MPLEIVLGESDETVEVADLVLKHLARYRQLGKRQTEAGGQLFGTVTGSTISILEATGPRKSDHRSRYSYVPDRRVEQREIDERFAVGLHFLGDWHAHPELLPSPSGTDLRDMKECVKRSERAVSGFLLLIVGTAPIPRGLHASLHDGNEVLFLEIREIPLKASKDDGSSRTA
jgi:integrative and conjugative element protein (TIGR02256 family)